MYMIIIVQVVFHQSLGTFLSSNLKVHVVAPYTVARALVSAAWQVSFPSLSQNGIIVNAVHSHVNEL